VQFPSIIYTQNNCQSHFYCTYIFRHSLIVLFNIVLSSPKAVVLNKPGYGVRELMGDGGAKRVLDVFLLAATWM